MLPVIRRYEPPIKRRLRIRNKKRLIVSLVHELVQKSGIKAHELKDGDIIYIPELGE